MEWLNPARWLLVLAAVAAAGLGLWRLDASRQQIGYDRAQAEYTAAALKASEAARAKEAQLATTNRRLQDDLEAAKTRHAAAVAAADDAERVFLSALGTPSATGADTATSARAAGAGAERELLGACAQTLIGVAKEADRIEGKLTALQNYVQHICRPG